MIAADIEKEVRQKLPDVHVVVAEPVFQGGLWHVDFSRENRAVSVQIEADDKIGLTVLPSDYGFEADEYFADASSASRRVVDALGGGGEFPTLGRMIILK